MAKKSEQYWAERMAAEEAATTENSAQYLSRIKLEYQAGRRSLEQALQALYRQYGDENGVPLTELRRKLKPEEWRAYQKKIEKLLQESGQLNSRKARNQYLTGRIDRLQALKNQTELEIERICKSQNITMLHHLQDTYTESYYHTAYELGKAAIVGSFHRLNPRQVEQICKLPWSGKSFSERIWDNTEKLKREARAILSTGAISGTSVQVMSRKLASRMDVSYHQAATLVRTESARMREQATSDSFEQHGVKKYKIFATLDTKTSSICRSMDGKIFLVSEQVVGKNCPPFHPNCRTTKIPWFDDFNIGTTRAARDKDGKSIEVPADMTYQEWYNQYIEGKAPTPKATPPEVGKVAFVPAKSVSGATQYAKKELGIPTVSYKGLDIQTANAWNEGLQDNFLRFPELKKKIQFTGEAHEQNRQLKNHVTQIFFTEYQAVLPEESEKTLEYYAKERAKQWMAGFVIPEDTVAVSWMPEQKILKKYAGIAINSKYGKNAEALIRAQQNDVEIKHRPIGCDTIRSVLDHELGHQLDDMLEISNLPTIRELYDSRSHEKLTEDLCSYAWDNQNENLYAEMIAEAWAEYCNNPEPREIAQKIGKVIEEAYQKKYGGGDSK